jgi:hypothetical protein
MHTFEDEARVLARYLVGSDPPAHVVERYVLGVRVRLEAAQPMSDPVGRFAVAHPWSAGALDAGSALLNKEGPLRERLVLMAAILETAPEFAVHFMPAAETRLRLAAIVAWNLWEAAVLALIGVPLLLVLRGRRA